MFVRKSTHAAVIAERDEARRAVERMARQQTSDRQEINRLRGARVKLRDDVSDLEAQLAATYVRNAKGQIVRHPSAAK